MTARKTGGAGAGTNSSSAPKAPIAPAADKAGVTGAGANAPKEIEDLTKQAIGTQKVADIKNDLPEVINPNPTGTAGADGKPSSTVSPELKNVPTSSEGQKAEFARAVKLFGISALAFKDADEADLKMVNDAKEQELNVANAPEPAKQLVPIEEKFNQPANAFQNNDFVAEPGFVIAQKRNGDRMRFTRMSWNLMQKNPAQSDSQDAWTEVPNVPKEVQNLQK